MYWSEGMEMTKEHSITFFGAKTQLFPDEDYDQVSTSGNAVHKMFYSQNTAKDWVIVPSERPVISAPSVKRHTIDIPGGYGKIDCTYVLTGIPTYDNRSGSVTFKVMNGVRPWDVAYSTIMGYLHGRRVKAILWDDPNYYYEGVCEVNSWGNDDHWSSISINYDFKPFKMEVTASDELELWDNFDFERHCTIGDLFTDIPLYSDFIGTAVDKVPDNAYRIDFSNLPRLILTDDDKKTSPYVSMFIKLKDTVEVSPSDLAYGVPLGRMPLRPEFTLYGRNPDAEYGTVRFCWYLYNQEKNITDDTGYSFYDKTTLGPQSYTNEKITLSMSNPANRCILAMWIFQPEGDTKNYRTPTGPTTMRFRRGYL